MKNKGWLILTILGSLAVVAVILDLSSFRSFDRSPFGGNFPVEQPPWIELLPYLLLVKTILTSGEQALG